VADEIGYPSSLSQLIFPKELLKFVWVAGNRKPSPATTAYYAIPTRSSTDISTVEKYGIPFFACPQAGRPPAFVVFIPTL
jgi:hypothetical protein